MIKEFFRRFYGYDFLKECIDDLRRDVAKLYGETATNKDTANQIAIEFLLDRVEVDNNFFNKYKWTPYLDLPWYMKRLFRNKYKLEYFNIYLCFENGLDNDYVGLDEKSIPREYRKERRSVFHILWSLQQAGSSQYPKHHHLWCS